MLQLPAYQYETLINAYNRQVSMSQQANQINQKFKMEIRKKQREDIMKKQREIYQEYQKKQQQTPINSMFEATHQEGQNNLQTQIIKMYSNFKNNQRFIEQLSPQQTNRITALLLTDTSLQINQGITLLGYFIQFCGSYAPSAKAKAPSIKKLISDASLQKKLLSLINDQVNKLDHKRVKMLLFCLSKMALIRMQGLLNKQLLQQYLPILIQNFISEASVLIIMAYISETYPFSPNIVRLICNQISSKEKIVKVAVTSTLINYINSQQNSENIYDVFDKLLSTLQHLYIRCKQFGQRFGQPLLYAIQTLISKFPQKQQQLLRRISKSNIQNTMIVLLTVGTIDTKQIVFEIQETIIDKTIHAINSQFFNKFSFDVICHIVLGIQFSRESIVIRCLKILNKLFYYAPKHFIHRLEAQNQIKSVLQDLVFSKNTLISQMAEMLQKYLDKQKQMQAEEY